MKSRNRTNTLLIELLIVVFFFMMGSVILVQVFGKAREASVRARVLEDAVSRGQSLADLLYRSDNPETVLEEKGFEKLSGEDAGRLLELLQGPDWLDAQTSAYQLTVSEEYGEQLTAWVETDTDEAAPGLRRMLVSAWQGDEALLTLPCSRYIGSSTVEEDKEGA